MNASAWSSARNTCTGARSNANTSLLLPGSSTLRRMPAVRCRGTGSQNGPRNGHDEVAEHEIGRRLGVLRVAVQPLDRVLRPSASSSMSTERTENSPSYAPAWLGSQGSTRGAATRSGPAAGGRRAVVEVGSGPAAAAPGREAPGRRAAARDQPEVVHGLARDAATGRSGRTRSAPRAGRGTRRPRHVEAHVHEDRGRLAAAVDHHEVVEPARLELAGLDRRARRSGRPARRDAAATRPGGSRISTGRPSSTSSKPASPTEANSLVDAPGLARTAGCGTRRRASRRSRTASRRDSRGSRRGSTVSSASTETRSASAPRADVLHPDAVVQRAEPGGRAGRVAGLRVAGVLAHDVRRPRRRRIAEEVEERLRRSAPSGAPRARSSGR